MRLLPKLGLSLALALVFPGIASADTFCVNDSECAGTSYGTIQDAVNAAAANGSGLDRIEIGAGSYVGSVTTAAGNPVEIVGAGPSETLISQADAKFSIAAGKTKTVKVRVAKRYRKKLLRATRRKGLSIGAIALTYDVAKNARTTQARLLIRRRR